MAPFRVWGKQKQFFVIIQTQGFKAERLSADLTLEFPDLAGFSPRNLWDMKKFYEYYACADTKLRQCVAVLPWKYKLADEKMQQSAAFLPWMHNILIMSKGQVDIELALRDFKKPIAVAELAFDFPEKEIKELINREIEAYKLENIKHE